MLAQWSEEALMTFLTTDQLPSGGTVAIFSLPSEYMGAKLPWPGVCAATTATALRNSWPAVKGPTQ